VAARLRLCQLGSAYVHRRTAPGPPPRRPVVTPIPGADRYEPNFNFDGATLFALGVKYTNLNFAPWAGSDPNSPDNDFYKVYVKPGLLVTCETLELAPGVDTNLILYDNNTNGIGGSEDIDRAAGNFASRRRTMSRTKDACTRWGNVSNRPEVAANSPTVFSATSAGVDAHADHDLNRDTADADPDNTPTPSLVPTLTPTPRRRRRSSW
jgi:hypothetical protein